MDKTFNEAKSVINSVLNTTFTPHVEYIVSFQSDLLNKNY